MVEIRIKYLYNIIGTKKKKGKKVINRYKNRMKTESSVRGNR